MSNLDWHSQNDKVGNQQIYKQYKCLYYVPSNGNYTLSYQNNNGNYISLGIVISIDWKTIHSNHIVIQGLENTTQVSCNTFNIVNSNITCNLINTTIISCVSGTIHTHNALPPTSLTLLANQHYIDYSVYKHLYKRIVDKLNKDVYTYNMGNVYTNTAFTNTNDTKCVSFVKAQFHTGDVETTVTTHCGHLTKTYGIGSFNYNKSHPQANRATIGIFHHNSSIDHINGEGDNDILKCTFRGNYFTPIAIT